MYKLCDYALPRNWGLLDSSYNRKIHVQRYGTTKGICIHLTVSLSQKWRHRKQMTVGAYIYGQGVSSRCEKRSQLPNDLFHLPERPSCWPFISKSRSSSRRPLWEMVEISHTAADLREFNHAINCIQRLDWTASLNSPTLESPLNTVPRTTCPFYIVTPPALIVKRLNYRTTQTVDTFLTRMES
jgi:hypothetical protein